MDRWKSRGGKSQRRRKKIKVLEKIENLPGAVFSNVLWLRRVEK